MIRVRESVRQINNEFHEAILARTAMHLKEHPSGL